MAMTLVLLRHGQSEWNEKNLFTGWWDSDLTVLGEKEARHAGELLAEEDLLPDVAHTSVQTRAIRTTNLSLDVCGRSWIPVRRSWRLNERHYGALTGKNKKETVAKYGAEQVHQWRRGYDTPPPPIKRDSKYDVSSDPRYADLPIDVIPLGECLKDVLVRALPYWADGIVPDLKTGKVVLVGAHGNSLRALVKHLDGISDAAIADLNIPTGNPLVYELGDDLKPIAPRRYLDPEAAAAGEEAVRSQTG